MRVVADLDLVVLTRHRRIRSRPAELRAYWEFGLRSVWIGTKRDLAPADQLELLLKHEARLRREIHKLGEGPWALARGETGLSPLKLRMPETER